MRLAWSDHAQTVDTGVIARKKKAIVRFRMMRAGRGRFQFMETG
jgi:hypothetical protein